MTISSTLNSIQLVPYIMYIIIAATNSEVSARRNHSRDAMYNLQIRGDAAVAILSKSNGNNESDAKSSTLGECFTHN